MHMQQYVVDSLVAPSLNVDSLTSAGFRLSPQMDATCLSCWFLNQVAIKQRSQVMITDGWPRT